MTGAHAPSVRRLASCQTQFLIGRMPITGGKMRVLPDSRWTSRVKRSRFAPMTHPLEQLREDARREIGSAADEQALEAARIKYLGKSGSISTWGEQMKALAKEEKPVVGKLLNDVRNAVSAAIEARAQQFRSQKESGALAKIDISLPGTPRDIGALHPLTQMWE